jgi:hypothetical protein
MLAITRRFLGFVFAASLCTLGVGNFGERAMAADTPTAKAVTVTSGKLATFKGKLAEGAPVDLAFAAKSSMACWPAPKNEHFSGNHVFFTTSLPPKSVMKIRAIPAKPDLDISLYAYQIGTNDKTLPPAISSCTTCEASYGSNNINSPYNPGATEQVELNATTNPYNVVIGVAGAQGLKKGEFTLEIDLVTAAPPPSGVITEATPIAAESGKTVSVNGKIDKGLLIDLAWAANSSVACFPATSFDQFDGQHVMYQFDLPKNTTATVELIPKSATVDLNLYAYSVAAGSTVLPPNVPSCVSCEASYGTNNINQRYNPGGSEKVELVAITNPYRVFVGVAGSQKITKGNFELKVTLKPR